METTVLLFLACLARASGASFSNKDVIQPVPLQDVQLQYNSQFDKAVSLNKEYLLELDTDRLLKTFRLTAGLDAPGEPFSGSWEDPGCEVRGQYMGHWLSGTAMLGKNSGDKDILNKADKVVKELRKVQQKLGGGYLSAFPTEHFDRLKSFHQVWAPFYVIHKIMAGLLDQHLFLGNDLALQMVVEEAEFFLRYVEEVIQEKGRDYWNQMLEIEYGGMEETLFNLYATTRNETWAKMAKYFTKPNFFEPLLTAVDTLPNRHANTHLAQVNGFASGYEQTGDQDRLAATTNFFDIVTSAHSYATGGSNANEFWIAPRELATTIYGEGSGRDTEETCTTYNMLKIARYLFRWSGDPRYADYYERAVMNGMLGVQRMPAEYASSMHDHSHGHSHVHAQGHVHTHPAQPGNAAQARSLLGVQLDDGNARMMTEASTALFSQPVNSLDKQTLNTNSTHTAPVEDYNWRNLAFQMFSPNKSQTEDSNAPGPGVILYLLPLGFGNTKDDSWHHWSTPLNSFWCCSGSSSEQFGKLMDSIYFERETQGSPPELYINQYTPSTLHWRMGGLAVTLNASLYDLDNVARVRIGFEPLPGPSDTSREAVVKLRVPEWIRLEGSSVVLNGGEVAARNEDLRPRSYLAMKRAFKPGDVIDVVLPMKIRTEKISDWRPQFKNLQAVLMGPFLMAALTDNSRDIRADPSAIASLIHNVSSAGLFTLADGKGAVLRQSNATLVAMQDSSACAAAMECTFRLLRKSLASNGKAVLTAIEGPTTNEEVVIESMTVPGLYLTINNQGEAVMRQLPPSFAPVWSLSPSEEDADKLTLSLASDARRAVAEMNAGNVTVAIAGSPGPKPAKLSLEKPLGSYPEGARILQGEDRSYVLVPLGNIVEERYTTYLEFRADGGRLLPSAKAWLLRIFDALSQ